MKNLLITYSFCLLALLNLGCDNSSEGTLIPTTVILETQILEEGGVTLIGDFQNFPEGAELGFHIFNVDLGYTEYIVPNPKVGTNTLTILTGLSLDKKYFCNTFIRTSDDQVFSLTKEFYAASGSAIPEIESITPSVGYIGDLIEITLADKLVGAKKEDFNIKLQNDVEIVDIIDEQRIIIRVPKFLSVHEYYRYTWAKLSISYLDKVIPTDYEFNIKAPTIESISPKLIDWGGEIIIKGDFYKEGYPTDFVTVNINEVPVTKITKVTPTEIRLEVSIHMFVNNPKLLLGINNRGVTETNTFSYYTPEIISVQEGAIGDEVEIIGNHFWPASYVNEVYFDNYKAEIITGEPTKLVVKVPQGTYTDNTAILKVRVTDDLISEPKTFVFK